MKEGGKLELKPSDKSPCAYSYQKDGYCDFKIIQNNLFNYVNKNKESCEEKACLKKLYKKALTLYENIKDDPEKLDEILPDDVKKNIYKTGGPAFTDELLNNFNIDHLLQDLCTATITGAIKAKKTLHIHFEMRDFAKRLNSKLQELDLAKIREIGFEQFCCVLNTDYWSGGGKHWVCIFGNLLPDKTLIEYFNSSGNGLENFKEIAEWAKMLDSKYPPVEIYEVVEDTLQYSDTECGVWCLWYIKKRIDGESPDYFKKKKTTDEDIKNARKYLFSKYKGLFD